MGNQVIHIETDGLLQIRQLSNALADKMNEANKEINKVISSNGWNCPEKRRMEDGLNDLSKATRHVYQAGIDYAVEAASASQRFEECARRVNGLFNFWGTSTEMWQVVNESMGETVISPIGPKTLELLEILKMRWFRNHSNNSQFQGTTQQIYAGLLGAGIIVSPFLLPTLIAKKITSIMEEVISKPDNSGNSLNGAPRQPLPDYARNPLGPDANGVYGETVRGAYGTGSICMCNPPRTVFPDGSVKYPMSCTYYTLRKLRERGIEYPTYNGNPGNGGDWVRNLDPNAHVPKDTSGEGAITNLVNQNGLPQDNVVVSFTTYDKNGNPNEGHVLLIDHIYMKDGVPTVKFSDIWNCENGNVLYVDTKFNGVQDVEVGNQNASNQVTEMSLAAFQEKYSSLGSYVNSATILGAGEGNY